VDALTLTPLQHIPLIRQGSNLADIVVSALQENKIGLANNDILVFAQKIISKAEGRAVNLTAVTPSQKAIELARQIDKDARVVELILRESNEVLRTRPGTIIVEHKLGFVCANAGIDHSNVDSPLPEGEGQGVRGGGGGGGREILPRSGCCSFQRNQIAPQKSSATRSNPKQGNGSGS